MSKVFSLTQVANVLNVDEKRVKDWLKEGWLLGEKIKTEWHITESNLIDFLAKNPTVLLAGSSKGFADGLGKNARLYYPEGVAVDLAGIVYVADTKNHRIRKITQLGEVTTIAGSDEHGYVDGLGKEARFNTPNTVIVDSNGCLYVSDTFNHVIRKVFPDGQVITFAGSGKRGFADGKATEAKFFRPNGIALDQKGNLYVADRENHAIRKIDTQGIVTTLAGGVVGYSDGKAKDSKFNSPKGLAIDKAGNLYIVDTGTSVIRKLTIDGIVSTIAGRGGNYMSSAPEDSTPARKTYLYQPKCLVVDENNNVYVSYQNVVKKISPDGGFTDFAGQGGLPYKEGLAKEAKFYEPEGLAIDCQGSMYIADTSNSKIRKILAPGIISKSFKPLDSLSEQQLEEIEAKRQLISIAQNKPLKDKPITPPPQSINLSPSVTSTTAIRQKFTIPKAEEFYCLYLDERNNPCGLMDKYDVIQKTAQQADIEDILDVLENPSDPGQVIAALVITSRVLASKPEYTERVQSALLNLASDPRIYQAKIEGYNQQVGMVGYLTNQPYYDIVNKKQDIEDRFLDITLGIDAALRNPESGSMSISYQGLDAFYKLFNSLEPKAREEKAKQIGDFFYEIILDKSRPSVERITAYELIDAEIKRNRETKNAFEKLLKKAASLLVNILLDKQENKELQTYIRYNLNKIAPDAVEMLQAKGILASSPVPNILDIMGSSDIDSSKLNKAAQEVSAAEVLEILQNYRDRDIEKVLPAIYLAPIVARRFNWRAFAQSLTNLLFVYKPYSFKTTYATVTKEVSKECSQQLATLLKERPESDKEIVLNYALKAVEIILDRGFIYSHYSDALSWELKSIFSNLKADDLLKNLLMGCFCSTWRSAAARFLAYKELGWDAQDAHQKAWEMLLDPLENATFRSLIGTNIYNHVKKELATLVDTSQTPWQLLPKAPTDLPISNPKESVPEVWLISTLNMSSDNEVLKQAINHLAERLKIDPSYTREELNHTREKVVALIEKYPDIKEVIKKICKNTTHKNIAIVAARMLALLGDVEEEETMIGLVADGIDGWTTLKPFSSEWTGMGLLMSILASNEVTDNVYSVFEPYLIVGYGDERARLMASKVFVLLAQKYEQAGKKEKAVKAYKWAIKRDGYNLVAREGLKKLEEANS